MVTERHVIGCSVLTKQGLQQSIEDSVIIVIKCANSKPHCDAIVFFDLTKCVVVSHYILVDCDMFLYTDA